MFHLREYSAMADEMIDMIAEANQGQLFRTVFGRRREAGRKIRRTKKLTERARPVVHCLRRVLFGSVFTDALEAVTDENKEQRLMPTLSAITTAMLTHMLESEHYSDAARNALDRIPYLSAQLSEKSWSDVRADPVLRARTKRWIALLQDLAEDRSGVPHMSPTQLAVAVVCAHRVAAVQSVWRDAEKDVDVIADSLDVDFEGH